MSLALGLSLFDRPSRARKLGRRGLWLAFVVLAAVLRPAAAVENPSDDGADTHARRQAEPPKPLLLDQPSWKRFDAALDSIVTASFDKTPLPDALAAIMRQLPESRRVKFAFDEQWVEGLPIGGSKPEELLVTLRAKDIRLRSALSLMLRKCELDWTLAADRLVVTDDSGRTPSLSRDYDVRDLVSAPLRPRGNPLNELTNPRIEHANDVKDAIYLAAEIGGTPADGAKLVQESPQQIGIWRITASARAHEEVGDLFRGMRARGQNSWRSPLERRVAVAMNERVSVDFSKIPLGEALAALIDMLPPEKRLPLVIDSRSLEEASVAPNLSVSLRAENVRLASALELLLQTWELDCVGRDDVLLVTTREKADSYEVARIHDLAGIATRHAQDGIQYDYYWHRSMISGFVAPTSWPEGNNYLSVIWPIGDGRLVIRQSPRIHAEIEQMLARWRSPLNAKDVEAVNGVFGDGRGVDAARYRSALGRPITARFENRPLSQVVRELSQSAPAASRVSIVLDWKRIEEEQFGVEHAPVDINTCLLVTQDFKNVSLETILHRLLKPLDLDWVAENDVLLITTREHIESNSLGFAAYDVSDLLPEKEYVLPPASGPQRRGGRRRGARLPDAQRRGPAPIEQIEEMLSATVAPTSWNTVGGPGSIAVDRTHRGVLLVSQTRDVHREIALLLRQWRSSAPESPPAIQNARWAAALEHRVSVDFHDQPLTDVLKSLSDSLPVDRRVTFEFDTKGLEDASLSVHSHVTFRARNVRLRSALWLILHPLEMGILEKDGVKLCTSYETACEWETPRVYDVSDLVPVGHDAASSAEAAARMNELGKVIQATIAPTSWDAVGGAGSIVPLSGKKSWMVVNQNRSIHEELRRLLCELRSTRYAPRESAMDAFVSREDQSRYAAALATEVSVDFDAKPLNEALAALEALVPAERRFSIVFRDGVLQEMSIDPNRPIALSHFRGSLADALAACLGPLDLGVAWQHDVLLVCPAEDADLSSTVVRAYDVTKMIESVDAKGVRHPDRGKFDALLATIPQLAPAETWDAAGGYGSIAPLELGRRWLIVNHAARVQADIAKLLERIEVGIGVQ